MTDCILVNCSCSDQPLDVYINMNVNDISSISETKMASTEQHKITRKQTSYIIKLLVD